MLNNCRWHTLGRKEEEKEKTRWRGCSSGAAPWARGDGCACAACFCSVWLGVVCCGTYGPTSPCCTCIRADGKPISASAVSVQTGKTYEQEFSLEIEKAKVQFPSRWWLVCRSPGLLSLSQLQLCIATGGQGEEHAVGLVISGAAPDLAW